MTKTNLTDARVAALRPRNTPYDIRDGKLRGFGVRVPPSGRKRFFIHCQHRGERTWKIVGDAGDLSVGEARSLAGEMLAAIRCREPAPCAPGETLFEAVAEATFRRHERIWKPGTMRVNRNYLSRRILPHFAGRSIADIDGREVRNWFAARQPGRGRPVDAGALGHHEGGRGDGPQARGLQPVPGHSAKPPQGARAVPLRRRTPPPVREARGP